jgi:NADP-dependent 3-hydroxy acid dehydrogenase YdfG
MTREMGNLVVVITGASTGIGRATALSSLGREHPLWSAAAANKFCRDLQSTAKS